MMESKFRLLSGLVCSTLLLVLALSAACKSEKSDDAALASSAEPLAAGEHKGKRELPPAAFEACQGKAVGDACTVQFGSQPIEATCAASPDGRLACRPERGQRNGRRLLIAAKPKHRLELGLTPQASESRGFESRLA